MSARELMPTDGLKEFTWTIVEKQSAIDTNNNDGQVIEFGSPLWIGRASYRDLNALAARKLTAWIARRKRSLVTFTAFRPLFRNPYLNPSQTNTGLGIGTVDVGASTIALTGLSANVTEGDMISYRTEANGYWVGQATAAATQSSGNATVSVWPPPMPKHATTPAVRLSEALGEFKLVDTPQSNEQHVRRGSFSFSCIQFVE